MTRLDGVVGPAPQDSAGNANAETEARMIARILAGERELFHELIRPYEKKLFLAAYGVLQNKADAEDVAQEAVLKAYRALGGFRAEAKFSTWLMTIALNEAKARIRRGHIVEFESLDKTRNEDEDFTPAVIADWREVPLEALERQELREMLQKAIASLPEIYREVFMLRDVQELNVAETAQALSVNEGVVRTRLLRARLMMQKMLAPQLKSKRGGILDLFRGKAGASWF